MRAEVLLLALLVTACEAGPAKQLSEYPDSSSEAFNVYARNCSLCHAPPLPSMHTAIAWPNVIVRMQKHRLNRSMAPIATADIEVLRDYLVAHAGKGEEG